MIALIQRVTSANVSVAKEVIGQIGQGYCIFLGIRDDDTERDIDYLISKILKIQLFAHGEGKFDQSIKDLARKQILVVSQFTLYGSLRKGSYPSFTHAMKPQEAQKLYNLFCKKLAEHKIDVETGKFGALMQVSLQNDGPVTFNLSSDHLKNG